jgi:hypothetical protein
VLGNISLAESAAPAIIERVGANLQRRPQPARPSAAETSIKDPTMRTLPLTLSVVAALLACGPLARADEAGQPIEQVVDHYVDARLQQEGIKPAAQADDANLLRRLTLDLVGRIPTVTETRAYVASPDPNKRVQLVDRLLAAPGFVRHQVNELDVLLMAGNRGSLREYLTRTIGENRPWDEIFRDLVLTGESDKTKGAGEFLKARVTDLDKLTNDVSTTFFGVNISCARCHDHPRVPDWKQDHFFGMKSFFNRTFDNGGFLAEREYGVVKFKTTAGQDKQARLMFLTGKVIDDPSPGEPSNEEQKKEKERLDNFKKNKTPPPPPKFSTRAALVDLALQPGQRDFFARSIVNRVWYRLFGQGLVMPLDQMHSENPPSHPELLQWLADDLVEHHYDLRHLVRGLVLSKAYSRSSRCDGDSPPKASLFAVARVRPLTPMQLASALRLATIDPLSLPADLKPDEFEKRLESLEAGTRGFADLFEQPREDFQISVGEALLFSNGERIEKELLTDGGDRLVGRLKQLNDPQERVDLAVRAVLSRPPTPEETKLLGEYLQKRSDRPAEACRQLVWALLASAEFRFNY